MSPGPGWPRPASAAMWSRCRSRAVSAGRWPPARTWSGPRRHAGRSPGPSGYAARRRSPRPPATCADDHGNVPFNGTAGPEVDAPGAQPLPFIRASRHDSGTCLARRSILLDALPLRATPARGVFCWPPRLHSPRQRRSAMTNSTARAGASATGAQSLVRSLEAAGVEVVFGIPGGAILPAYDPLFDSTALRHILVRHEQGAGHAAEGYAQATGRVGVCMATSGPGATNLVTPIADAYMDSVPIVAITGQVPRPAIGTDAFQEADIQGITLPITKHNFLVQNADEIPRILAEAFHLASTGRPGPVLVDIPKDVLQAQTSFSWPPTLD